MVMAVLFRLFVGFFVVAVFLFKDFQEENQAQEENESEEYHQENNFCSVCKLVGDLPGLK